MKLVIGTAQFGIKGYGINNSNLTNLEIEQIMEFSRENHIRLFDTSDLYGESLKIIDNFVSPGMSQILKVNEIENLKNFFKNIKTPIHSILIHDIDKIDIQEFKDFIYKNKIKNYGISIYTYKEFENFLKTGLIPNIIEIPFSIVDTEFLKYFEKLKELKVKIIVRSIFMQGILFNRKIDIPEKLHPFREVIDKIDKIENKHGVSKSQLMFNFIKAYSEFIDYVVIGVNSIDELKQNYKEFKKPFKNSIFQDSKNINESLMPFYKKINNWKFL